MPSSTPQLPSDRHAIGQLLVRLLHHFRVDLAGTEGLVAAFDDLRFPHMQIWGNVGVDGIRLTTLANRANLSLAVCCELVNELQDAGYLERRPDPDDGRAKLIFPTAKGRRVLAAAGHGVAAIEQHWRSICRPGEFDDACTALNDLLNALDASPADN